MAVPPAVASFLDRLVSVMRGELGRDLLGVYLGGSLALGDHQQATSDVDVAVVCAHPLGRAQRHRLIRALTSLADEVPGRGLELVVYRRDQAGAPERGGFELNLNAGPGLPFHVATRDDDEARFWFVLDAALLRARGVAVRGPPPHDLFAPVDHLALVAALEDSLRWHVAHGDRAQDIVLNACRAWYAVENAAVTGKSEAAAWAARRAPGAAGLIEAAVRARRGEGSGPVPDEAARAFAAEILLRLRDGDDTLERRAMPPRPVRASVWWEAARPRTLPAALTPVLVGTAAAERFLPWRAAGALVVALAVQVGVNYANDYFDGTRGVDTPARLGPRRAVAAGLVTPAAMRRATALALTVAALTGSALALAVGWELLVVGVLCFLAALGYSGGPRPYAAIPGAGEAFVFAFFGLAATVGSQYVQDEAVAPLSVTAAIPVGFLATALLVVNNLRDIPTDAAAGKTTLAVALGPGATRGLHAGLIVAAFALVPAAAAVAGSWWPLAALLAVPLGVLAGRRVQRARDPGQLIGGLEVTAQLHLAFGVLLAGGLALA